MRILKAEVSSLHEDEPVAGTPVTAAASGTDGQQSQIDALQQQVRDLQRAATQQPG